MDSDGSYAINMFSNLGYIQGTLSENVSSLLMEEIDEIQSDFTKAIPHNQYLAGQIRHEYAIVKTKSILEQELGVYVNEYDIQYNYLKHLYHLTKNVPISLNQCWVNYQQKAEFNPPHSHSGYLSFVIWMKVPYDSDKEINAGPGTESNIKLNGQFTFYYVNSLGQMSTEYIPIDKTMENQFILFPSCIYHSVHPFYSSDDYRISVAGNFYLNVG